MSSTTTRLQIPYPVSSDLLSAFPAVAQSAANIADKSAQYASGTLASRPAAGSVPDGTFYRSTDAGNINCSDGASNWVSMGTNVVGGQFTFTGNGQTYQSITIPHGLGTTPKSVMATPTGWQGIAYIQQLATSTNFIVQATTVGGGSFASGTTYYLYWLAF